MSIRESHTRLGVPTPAAESSKPLPAGIGLLSRLLAVVRTASRRSGLKSWSRRRRDWQILAAFNDRMLRDIGINRARVDRDSSTSFWRLR